MLWQIVRWEIMRHVRNKQFLIGLFLTPVIFALFAGLPMLMDRIDKPQERVYYVVDEIGALPILDNVLGEAAVTLRPHGPDEHVLHDAVLDGAVDGYFVLDRQFVDTGSVFVYMEKPRPRPEALDAALTALLQSLRMQEQQIGPDVLAYVSQRPRIETTALAVSDGKDPLGGLIMAGVFAFLLFFLIVSSGSMLLQSAVQEKRDRMSEVVLSSVGAETLMSGKIIGHFILGAFQIAFWLAIGLPVAHFALKLPLADVIVLEQLPVLAMFALLGYLFYAALFVGIGATMEDIQSASNSQGLVFMLPMLSFLALNPVISNPEGIIARVATFFPVTTPTIGILRYGMGVMTGWEVAAAGAVMVVSTYLVIRIASKLFRTGMLMYGKNATFKEIWKWLRHPA